MNTTKKIQDMFQNLDLYIGWKILEASPRSGVEASIKASEFRNRVEVQLKNLLDQKQDKEKHNGQ